MHRQTVFTYLFTGCWCIFAICEWKNQKEDGFRLRLRNPRVRCATGGGEGQLREPGKIFLPTNFGFDLFHNVMSVQVYRDTHGTPCVAAYLSHRHDRE
jgi:hypothetical protein